MNQTQKRRQRVEDNFFTRSEIIRKLVEIHRIIFQVRWTTTT